MTAARRAASLVVALVTAVGVFVTVHPARAAEPTLTVSTPRGDLGQQVTVTENGWTDTSVVTLCGNAGRRGAPDCDQIGGAGFPISENGPESRLITLRRPPVPCPCVLRAATPGEDIVVTVPIELIGVETAPLSPLDTVERGGLKVSATVVAGKASIANLLRSGLGGPTRRILVLRVTNNSPARLDGITVSAAVGRTAQGGDTLQAPNIDALEPGESRSYSVPVSLDAPSYGSYKVFGTVYSPAGPATFSVTTRTTPGLLYLLVVVLVADLVALGAMRARRRHQQSEQGATNPAIEAPISPVVDPSWPLPEQDENAR